jgi:hypothetical protein
MEEGCLYCQKEIEGRKDKKYCSTICKKYYSRWIKGEPRTPFSFNRVLSEEEILLKEKAKRLSSINTTADLVLQNIELDHFEMVSNSDRRYLGFPRKKGT